MVEGENNFKDWILNNWGLKLLAILMGMLTFYAIRGATNFEVPYNIPVEVKVEKGTAILEQNPRIVEVVLRGSLEDLGQIGSMNIKAVVEPKASDATGSEKILLEDGNIKGVRGVRVVSIRPREVSLTFDRETEKKISVAPPSIVGKPMLGKVQIEYEPKVVTVRGSLRRLVDRKVLDTQPIDVNERIESFSTRVKVLPPGDMPGLKIEPAEVEAQVSIVTESASREWTDVKVTAMYKAGAQVKVSFEPETVHVLLHGREDVVRKIADKDVIAFVDCSSLATEAPGILPVNVYLPSGAGLNATITPDKIKVVLHESPKEDNNPMVAPQAGGK